MSISESLLKSVGSLDHFHILYIFLKIYMHALLLQLLLLNVLITNVTYSLTLNDTYHFKHILDR